MSVTKQRISKKSAKNSRKKTIYYKLRENKFLDFKKPSKTEVSKYSKGAKSYDEAYLKAFYKKNKNVIDYNLKKKETIALYGDNPYKMFKEMVLDKMFKINAKADTYYWKKRVKDPYEGRELSTKEAVQKVWHSGDMWGEKQVQTHNLKLALKEQGFDLRSIRDPKTGRIISIDKLDFIKKDKDITPTGKEITTYYYKIGNKVLVVHQSPKGGTMLDLVDEGDI